MRTNNTPFTDLCVLIGDAETTGTDGYTDSTEESRREIFCSVQDGVNRAEFYEAYKAGVRLAITVEVHADDFDGERELEHDGTLYEILRTYPTGHGTLELSCREVVR